VRIRHTEGYPLPQHASRVTLRSLMAGLIVMTMVAAGCSKSLITSAPKTIEPASAALSPPAETPPAGEVLPLPRAEVLAAALALPSALHEAATLALITVLSQPTERLPRLISIDEPELGLHPAAIALIAELCRSICRHTQIVLSTQSTELLDHFRVDEVVVVEREEGATSLKRLKEPDLRHWLEDYSLRDLYAKGVIGGTP
jgi:hypothetical protein